MPIEINQFTANIDNSQLVLSDNASGDLVIAKSQFSFAEKVMQWLTQIPLLSDLSAVQEFVQNQTEGNLKTLGVFLNALAHEYGEEFAGEVANKADFSGQTPLTARLVKQLTQGSVSVEKKEPQLVKRDNRQIQADRKVVEDSRLLTNKLMSQLEQAAKSITGYLTSPVPMPLPSALSYVGRLLFSETAPMKSLQEAVSAYNQAIRDSKLGDEAHKLAHVFQKPLPFNQVPASIKAFSVELETLKGCLKDVEMAISKLEQHQQNNVEQLKRVMFKENDRLDALESLANIYRQAWQSESEDYKAFSTFYETCTPALKSKLTPELVRLSFELINNSPNLDSKTLANRLSDKLVQYASDMSTVNLRVLPEVLVEKVPSLADEVLISFPKKEQKAEFGAIKLLKQAFKQSRTELMEERKGFDARFDMPDKINQIRHHAAWFEKEMEEFFASNSQLEDQFSATLAALTGDGWLVVQDIDPQPNYEDLNLTDQIRNELDRIQISDKARILAENVIQAQKRLSSLDNKNSVTYERHNRAGVDIYTEIKNKTLADNITQNLALYDDYLDEKISAVNDYKDSLSALANENIGKNVNEQLKDILAEANKQATQLTTLLDKIRAIQVANNAKDVLDKKVSLLDTMLDKTLDTNTKNLNLKGFLSFLPSLRTNNEDMRQLMQQQQKLEGDLKRQEHYLRDLKYKSGTNQTNIPLTKEVEKLNNLKSEAASLVQDIERLDDEYQKSILELIRFDGEVKKEKGYPDVSGNSLESWSAWGKQNVAGHLSGNYRPEISTLILERQMAKAGIEGYLDAYIKLVSTWKSSDVESIKEKLGQLHNWSMAHPVEAQLLAGNLTHTYQIIRSGYFGNDMATMAVTAWNTGSVENQVKDILQGSREYLPSDKSMSMTAEMFALLHFTGWLPYIAGAAKGLGLQGVIASVSAGLRVQGVPPAVLGMIGGLIQTWGERKMADAVNQNRSTEVMVNALMAGIHKQGSFNDRAKAIASYAMQRQALQDIGTLSRDCFETSKAGAMSRMWQDAKNTWQEMNWKAKSFTVATTAAGSIGAAAIAALSVIVIAGTGGVAIAIAAIAGACATPLGALLARTALNLIASTNFLGMNDAHNRAKENMTQQRIDEALQRLANKTKDDQRLGDLLGDSLKDARQLIQLNHLPEEQQETSFRLQIASIASKREQQVIEQNTLSKAKLIETAKSYVPESLLKDENGNIDWENCYQQVEQALVKQTA